MTGWLINTVMLTQEICNQLITKINSFCKGDIICSTVSADNRQKTILPEELSDERMSMSFTGITESSERNSIQEMQYERFARTMAEMMEKYQIEFQN